MIHHIILEKIASYITIEGLSQKKNIRLLELPDICKVEPGTKAKTVLGGFLVQDLDTEMYNAEDLKVVTEKAPTEKEMEDLLFAMKVFSSIEFWELLYFTIFCASCICAGSVESIFKTRSITKESLN